VYRERQVSLAERVAALLGRSLASLDDLSQSELERYVAAAYPAVAGGQRQAASTGAGYVTAITPAPPKRVAPVNVPGALKKSGVLVTAESRSLVAPVLRARSLVAEGVAYASAIDTAAAYAGSLSSLDLQAAQRVGLEEGARASGAEVTGWVKDTGGDACEWCEEISENVYESAEDVPFHDNCKCAVVPELERGSSSTAELDDDDDGIPF
jgi:hypothetical protein